ncbi:MAG: thioredoxin [Candidatus Moranbacteria bacterium]|nr:thioredoxin [Candidatus Moranbacteria bacterium]
MNKNIGIIIGVIVIAGIGFLIFSGDKTKKQNSISEVQNEVVTNEIPTSEQVNKEGTVTDSVTASVGLYEAYSPEKIALAENGDVIIFFHASWCPSCRALNVDIEKNVDAIPAGVIILKTDYDKETELKKKYGVTTQHTLVQVEKNGNLIKKWSGGSKLENLLSQIK